MAREPRYKITSEYTEAEYKAIRAAGKANDRTPSKQVRWWVLSNIISAHRGGKPLPADAHPKTK